jgi:ribosomal protein S12 methylthiotransferase
MKKPPAKKPLRVGMISLGCAKNLVDSEIMLGSLLKEGVEITNDVSAADAVIVNTCSFIDTAQQESVDAILESAAVRDANQRGQALIVSGCLPQRFREELPKLLPEVDAFIGIDQVTQVPEIVRASMARRAARVGGPPRAAGTGRRDKTMARLAELDQAQASAAPAVTQPLFEVHRRPQYVPDYATPRFRLTPRHTAYLKIAEGCNHPCSFCIIPQMRGSHRSRTQGDIVTEAKALIADGVRELNLISQDSTYYGLDLRANASRAIAAPDRFGSAVKSLPSGASTLCTLLRELNALPGDFWIRLLYTHPAHWTDELIRTIAECRKVARYVDIPLQHIHGNMLERMRRETSREYIVDLLKRIRAGVPGIALRTTFIVGFPGETDAYFESLLEFIRETRFERLGVFTYSQEAGTRAGSMAGQIPERTRRKRRDLAMAAQHQVAREVAQSFVGRTLRVLVESTASAKQLNRANISSWEHGFVRDTSPETLSLPPGTRSWLEARSEADAPDIDGRVYVRGRLPLGEFAEVRIVGHTDYDLVAEPA